MAVATPVLAWTASLLGSFTGANQSSSLTVTVNITQGWEITVPVNIRFSNVSADPVINAYKSNDGGVTYDTTPAYSISVARVASGQGRASVVIPVGQYALQILNSGPNSASIQVLTAVIVTAILNQ